MCIGPVDEGCPQHDQSDALKVAEPSLVTALLSVGMVSAALWWPNVVAVDLAAHALRAVAKMPEIK